MAEVSIGDIARWLQDHDTDVVDEAPPDLSAWYELFDDEDVRLLWCLVLQNNDETVAKDIEVRWTIDGNVYLHAFAADNASIYYIYRFYAPSAGGTAGLSATTSVFNAGYHIDKRGLDFQVEVRITEALGTNQRLRCWTVRETLEIT